MVISSDCLLIHLRARHIFTWARNVTAWFFIPAVGNPQEFPVVNNFKTHGSTNSYSKQTLFLSDSIIALFIRFGQKSGRGLLDPGGGGEGYVPHLTGMVFELSF